MEVAGSGNDGVHDGVHRMLPLPLDASASTSTSSSGEGAAAAAAASVCVKLVRYTEEQVARGVFALKRLERGTLVEVAHCIYVPKAEYEDHVKLTVFEHYVFKCKKTGGSLLCLGLGSLFNHNSTPCLDYRIDEENLLIRFYAARDIEEGEELTIFYGANLWFDDPTSGTKSLSSSPETEDNVFSKLCLD